MSFRISEIVAWTMVGDNDEEGIIAFRASDDTWMPLIGADRDRIVSMEKYAQSVANTMGKPVTLRSFAAGVIERTLEPQEEP